MATQHNFRIKNGLEVAGTERISSAGAFTGSLASATTATTQSATDNSTKIATTAYTDAAITAVIGGAPGTLDTLNELAAAINDDASYASTLTTALATKLPLSGGNLTGNIALTTSNTKISMTSTGSGDSELYFATASNGRGIYLDQSDANKLKIYDGSGKGTDGEVVIDNTGQVGIGQTNPARKLHIKDNGQIKLESTSSGGWVGLDFAAGNGTYDGYMGMLDSNGRFFIDVDSNGEDLTILQNGNVGIGTSSPLGKLSVGAGSINDAGLPVQISTGADGTQAWYAVNRNGGYGALFGYSASSTYKGLVLRNVVASGTSNADGISFMTNNTSMRMHIKGDGNVGIGTDDPSCKLEVSGTGGTKLKVTNTDTNWAGLDLQAGGNQANYIFFRDESAERARIMTTDGNEISFLTGAGVTQKLKISTNDIIMGTGAVNETAKVLSSGGTTVIRAADSNHSIVLRGTQDASGNITGNSNTMGFYEYGGYEFYTKQGNSRVKSLDMPAAGKVNIATSAPRSKYFDVNGVAEISESFYISNNIQYDFEYTVTSEGGTGNSFFIIAGYNHFYTTQFGAHKVAFMSARQSSMDTMINVGDQNSSYAGQWQFTKSAATTLRIRKTAGSYGGAGHGFIKVFFRDH